MFAQKYFNLTYLQICIIIIWLEDRLQSNIRFTLRCVLAVFTRSARTVL